MASFGNDEHGYGKIFDALHKAAVAFGSERSYGSDFFIDAQAIVGRPASTPFLWMIHNTSTHIWFADEDNFGPKAATPVYAQNLYRGQKEAIYYWNGSELLSIPDVVEAQSYLSSAADRLAHEAYMLDDAQKYGIRVEDEEVPYYKNGSAHGYADEE